jgi:hypothetical protein
MVTFRPSTKPAAAAVPPGRYRNQFSARPQVAWRIPQDDIILWCPDLTRLDQTTPSGDLDC